MMVAGRESRRTTVSFPVCRLSTVVSAWSRIRNVRTSGSLLQLHRLDVQFFALQPRQPARAASTGREQRRGRELGAAGVAARATLDLPNVEARAFERSPLR